jgi:hypothetical protein
VTPVEATTPDAYIDNSTLSPARGESLRAGFLTSHIVIFLVDSHRMRSTEHPKRSGAPGIAYGSPIGVFS